MTPAHSSVSTLLQRIQAFAALVLQPPKRGTLYIARGSGARRAIAGGAARRPVVNVWWSVRGAEEQQDRTMSATKVCGARAFLRLLSRPRRDDALVGQAESLRRGRYGSKLRTVCGRELCQQVTTLAGERSTHGEKVLTLPSRGAKLRATWHAACCCRADDPVLFVAQAKSSGTRKAWCPGKPPASRLFSRLITSTAMYNAYDAKQRLISPALRAKQACQNGGELSTRGMRPVTMHSRRCCFKTGYWVRDSPAISAEGISAWCPIPFRC